MVTEIVVYDWANGGTLLEKHNMNYEHNEDFPGDLDKVWEIIKEALSKDLYVMVKTFNRTAIIYVDDQMFS